MPTKMRQKARRFILVQSSVLEGAPEAPSWQDKDGLREIVSESYNHRNQPLTSIYIFIYSETLETFL